MAKVTPAKARGMNAADLLAIILSGLNPDGTSFALTVGDSTGQVQGSTPSADNANLGGNRGWQVSSAEFAFQGAGWDRLRTPNIFKPIAAVAVTAGTGVTIWTPAAGKKFRLMGWKLSLSAGASAIFGDNAIGTVILRSELVAAAGIAETAPGFGNGFLSAAANNVLKLDVTANATVSGYVFGTEE